MKIILAALALSLSAPAIAGFWSPGMPGHALVTKKARERQEEIRADRCYTEYRKPDFRAFCLALAHDSPGYCYNAQSPDVRAACLREFRP